MDKIKIHVLRTGEVRVSPYLPFGGDDCSIIKASGITTPKSKWIWLPVFSMCCSLLMRLKADEQQIPEKQAQVKKKHYLCAPLK
jgi:hypothetical protein